MAKLSKLMGWFDIPFLTPIRLPSAGAGTGSDYESAFLIIPDLTKLGASLASGQSGFPPAVTSYLRDIILSPEAAITGAATNNFAWQVRQWRAGAVLPQVTLASVTAISVGANTIVVTQSGAPNPLQNVRVGDILYISGGTGTAEYVQITAVAPSTGSITFTAANTHSGAYSMVNNALSSIWYNAGGVTEAQNTPHQSNTTNFNIIMPNYLKAGDVIMLQRLSFGTGLASPAVTVQADYTSVKGTAAAPLPRG